MEPLVTRLKEPSTYAGLAGFFLALGQALPHYASVLTPVAAVFGALATAMGETH